MKTQIVKMNQLLALIPELLAEAAVNVKLEVEHEAADPSLTFDYCNANGLDFRVKLTVEDVHSASGLSGLVTYAEDERDTGVPVDELVTLDGDLAHILGVVTDDNFGLPTEGSR